MLLICCGLPDICRLCRLLPVSWLQESDNEISPFTFLFTMWFWRRNWNSVLLFTIITSKTSCSQRKMSSPEHHLMLERWQGPPHLNKENGMKLCCPFGQFVYSAQSVMKRMRVCLFSSFRHLKKSQSKKIFLFRLKCLPQSYTVRLSCDCCINVHDAFNFFWCLKVQYVTHMGL